MLGGNCQINTIVGLYGALNIPFSLDDIRYINSFGVNLRAELQLVYDYLTNRPSMRELLFQNNLDPQVMIDKNFSWINLTGIKIPLLEPEEAGR